MTDFTAWRPAKIPAGAFRLPAGHTTDCGGRDAWFKEAKCNAEKSATAAFTQVLASGRYALLPNAKGPGPHCRVDGRFSSVVHDHSYAERCRADLSRRVYALPATRRTTERRGACLRWRSEHAVTPDMSWGTLPAVLQEKWTAYDCDHLLQDAIQREDEEARARTVRRGWNRTAGSRYEFAADGVTFASSGGI